MAEEMKNEVVGDNVKPQVQAVSFVPKMENVDLRDCQRIYLPLDGQEVMEAILTHIREKLVQSSKFLSQVSMDRVVWGFRVDVEYDSYMTGGTRVDGTGAIISEQKGDGEKTTETVVTSGRQVDKDIAPDELRQRTGQEVPVLKGTGGVVKVSPSKLGGKR